MSSERKKTEIEQKDSTGHIKKSNIKANLVPRDFHPAPKPVKRGGGGEG